MLKSGERKNSKRSMLIRTRLTRKEQARAKGSRRNQIYCKGKRYYDFYFTAYTAKSRKNSSTKIARDEAAGRATHRSRLVGSSASSGSSTNNGKSCRKRLAYLFT